MLVKNIMQMILASRLEIEEARLKSLNESFRNLHIPRESLVLILSIKDVIKEIKRQIKVLENYKHKENGN